MRKLILQMHTTMDGFVAGPGGQLDWMLPGITGSQMELLKELTNRMDTILMGRKMTSDFTTYWEGVVNEQPDNPEYPYAKIFVDTPKIVFSKTVSSIPGQNVFVENGDLVETVNKLKALEGKDMIVYGGAMFVSELIRNNLIDELYLLVNPVAIGEGLRIFRNRTQFELTASISCDNGLLINKFRQVNG